MAKTKAFPRLTACKSQRQQPFLGGESPDFARSAHVSRLPNAAAPGGLFVPTVGFSVEVGPDVGKLNSWGVELFT